MTRQGHSTSSIRVKLRDSSVSDELSKVEHMEPSKIGPLDEPGDVVVPSTVEGLLTELTAGDVGRDIAFLFERNLKDGTRIRCFSPGDANKYLSDTQIRRLDDCANLLGMNLEFDFPYPDEDKSLYFGLFPQQVDEELSFDKPTEFRPYPKLLSDVDVDGNFSWMPGPGGDIRKTFRISFEDRGRWAKTIADRGYPSFEMLEGMVGINVRGLRDDMSRGLNQFKLLVKELKGEK